MPRHYLTNKNGYLNLVQSGNTVLRVPLYAGTASGVQHGGAGNHRHGRRSVGQHLHSVVRQRRMYRHTRGGSDLHGTFPVNDVSLVSPFELQASAPVKSDIPAYTNIRHVGVAYDPATSLYMFAITTLGDWGSPTDVAFNVHVDNNEDGTDRILFNTNGGSLSSLVGTRAQTAHDTFINTVFNIAASNISMGGAGQYVNRVMQQQRTPCRSATQRDHSFGNSRPKLGLVRRYHLPLQGSVLFWQQPAVRAHARQQC